MVTHWPSPQDYNEAVQNRENIGDRALGQGRVYLDSCGLPRPISGGFATVYRFDCESSTLALRCFLTSISDQEARYQMLSEAFKRDALLPVVSFEFIETGIRVNGRWTPIVKMEWVDGKPLDQHVADILDSPSQLTQLAERFLALVGRLRQAGVAHGDLQHGNILVLPSNELRLVDYDSMFVPAMKGMKCHELGHANYQHPLRREHHFGSYLDNFSAWVIYTSIVALCHDKSLWKLLDAGDDCLLFRKSDFLCPEKSLAFAVLDKSESATVRRLSRFLRVQLLHSVEDVPPLALPIPNVEQGAKQAGRLNPTLDPEEKPAVGYTSEQLRNLTHQWSQRAAQTAPMFETRSMMFRNSRLSSAKPGVPRNTKWQSLPLTRNPFLWQTLLLLGAVWPLSSTYVDLVGVHDALLREGKTYSGVVTETELYKQKGCTRLAVRYHYVVDRQHYTAEDQVTARLEQYIHAGTKVEVVALPSNPAIHEPFLREAGTRKSADLQQLLWLATLVGICEILIWLPAWWDWWLMSFGRASTGRVNRVFSDRRREGVYFYVVLEYDANKTTYRIRKQISEKEARTIRPGAQLAVFYHEKFPAFAISEIGSSREIA